MRDFLPAIAFSLIAAIATFSATMAAPESGEMAVVFPPFTAETEAWATIRAAGAQIVAPTRIGNIVVVHASKTDFQTRARALGALFFVKAEGLCAPLRPEATS